MNLLNKFYADFQTKAAVKEALILHLKDRAWSKSCAGESTQGIKDARDAIECFFKDLDRTYEQKKARIITSNK